MDLTNKLNEYKVIRSIGKGTYGVVLLCKKNKCDYPVVLKELPVNSTSDEQYKEGQNEIIILSMLCHPNIIQYYDSFYESNYIYIAMEYATHGNLAEYMYIKQHSLLTQTEILFFFCQVLLGVQHIHQYNIVHRDLKAENILLSGPHGVTVKIGDFGIAKLLGNDKTMTVIGTPYYLAPELCDGKPYDTKTDVWALGCLLYEMCTHQRAFESDTLLGLVKTIVSCNVKRINKYCYEESMQELIDGMLTVDPEKRHSVNKLLAKPFLFPMLCSFCYTF